MSLRSWLTQQHYFYFIVVFVCGTSRAIGMDANRLSMGSPSSTRSINLIYTGILLLTRVGRVAQPGRAEEPHHYPHGWTLEAYAQSLQDTRITFNYNHCNLPFSTWKNQKRIAPNKNFVRLRKLWYNRSFHYLFNETQYQSVVCVSILYLYKTR